MMSKEESGRQLAGGSRWESSKRMERKEGRKALRRENWPPFYRRGRPSSLDGTANHRGGFPLSQTPLEEEDDDRSGCWSFSREPGPRLDAHRPLRASRPLTPSPDVPPPCSRCLWRADPGRGSPAPERIGLGSRFPSRSDSRHGRCTCREGRGLVGSASASAEGSENFALLWLSRKVDSGRREGHYGQNARW